MKRDDIDALMERVVRLERRLNMADHVHRYRYSKHIMEGPVGEPFWSWRCIDDDGETSKDCPQPSGGTNHRGGIPDHFPDALR